MHTLFVPYLDPVLNIHRDDDVHVCRIQNTKLHTEEEAIIFIEGPRFFRGIYDTYTTMIQTYMLYLC